MWLPLHSIVSEVNYHVATVEDGSFFCLSQQWFTHGASVHLPALPLRSLVFPRPPSSPRLIGRDPPALCIAAVLWSCVNFQNRLHPLTSPHLYRLIMVRTLYLCLPHLVPPSSYYYCRWSRSLSSSFQLSICQCGLCEAFNKIHGF